METSKTGQPLESPLSPKENQTDLSLIIPCYNEADSLRGTVMRLVRCFRDIDAHWELVLVDNGSSDDTGKIIDEMIREGLPIVKQVVEVNQGYGHGVLQGLQVARGRLLGYSCADAQVEAQDVAKLFDIGWNAKAPRLFKVRRRFRTEGLPRIFVSLAYNLTTRILFGPLGTTDINAIPKILPREYFERMNLQSKDWFLDAEVVIKANKLGLSLYEMNVFAQMRADGSSNVRLSTCREFIVNLLQYRFGRKKVLLSVQPPSNDGHKAEPAPRSISHHQPGRAG